MLVLSKILILILSLAIIKNAPLLRGHNLWLNKLYTGIIVFNLIAGYYGIIILIFTNVPLVADLALCALLLCFNLKYLHKTKNKLIMPKIKVHLPFVITACLHAVFLLLIYFIVQNHIDWQGADIIYGRMGSRSYLHNNFPYLKYSLLILNCFLMIEIFLIFFYGFIKKRIKNILIYVFVIICLLSLTIAANFTYLTQRDQWRHIGGVYNLIANNDYRINYLGQDIKDQTKQIGNLQIPIKYLVGTQTSYASNYGFYFFLAKLLNLRRLNSLINLYRLIHPLWWSVNILIISWFLLKTIGIKRKKERAIMIFTGFISIQALTMANLNFPQYSSATVFLLFLEHLIFVLKNKKQYLLLAPLFVLLLFSYASYPLLLICILPLVFYLNRVQWKIDVRAISGIVAAAVLAVLLLSVFNYYLGNFTQELNYSWSNSWLVMFRTLYQIGAQIFTGSLFFNLPFLAKIFTFHFITPVFWKILVYLTSWLILGTIILKTKKITLLHLITAILILSRNFIFTVSVGENLLMQRLEPLTLFFLAMIFGMAIYRMLTQKYQRVFGFALILIYSSLSFLSFVNVVHSVNIKDLPLIQNFYAKYGAKNNFCFAADEPEIVLLEAVSAQKIIGGNFSYSDAYYTKTDLIKIRDRIIFYQDKKPLLNYQKTHNLPICYVMNSLENYDKLTLLFGSPILENEKFAIWQSRLND